RAAPAAPPAGLRVAEVPARARGRRGLEVAGEGGGSASNPLLRLPGELAKPPAVPPGPAQAPPPAPSPRTGPAPIPAERRPLPGQRPPAGLLGWRYERPCRGPQDRALPARGRRAAPLRHGVVPGARQDLCHRPAGRNAPARVRRPAGGRGLRGAAPG